MSSRTTRRVYDNWQKLVEATLKRELLHELAFCPSFSSSSSIGSTSVDLSSRFDDSPTELDASLSSSSSLQGAVVVESSSSTRAINARQLAARLITAPAIALAHYITRKPTHKDKEIELKHIKRFSLGELQVASNSFSYENIIGYGRHGTVYEGRLSDGSLVAIKRLDGEELQFKTEVKIASMTDHPNLLGLLGICITPTERMLVYPYLCNLASVLRERSVSQPPLDWSKRKPIAVGTARGLAYLHDQCDLKIIHRDVKVLNIFLDEDFEAVTGCFGLALFMDHKDTHVTKTLRGTFGHIAPEYVTTGECSDRTDVYGYGVMLLELVTGQRAFNLAHLVNDNDMIFNGVKQLFMEQKLEKLVDVDLQGNYIIEEVEQLIQVALICTRGSPLNRPKMSEVVKMLEGDDLALAERWDEWLQNEEILIQRNTDQIISNSTSDYNYTDYMSDIEQEEFSEPR